VVSGSGCAGGGEELGGLVAVESEGLSVVDDAGSPDPVDGGAGDGGFVDGPGVEAGQGGQFAGDPGGSGAARFEGPDPGADVTGPGSGQGEAVGDSPGDPGAEVGLVGVPVTVLSPAPKERARPSRGRLAAGMIALHGAGRG
jgi:hypothetical protein